MPFFVPRMSGLFIKKDDESGGSGASDSKPAEERDVSRFDFVAENAGGVRGGGLCLEF